MIYNELFWYKAPFHLKAHYAKGDDVVDITDKDLDISGLGNDNYHKPDFSNGELDKAISAQNQALQAAEAAQKRAQEAQKAAQKAQADAIAAQNKVKQALDEYERATGANKELPDTIVGGATGDKGGVDSINIAGIVSAAGRVGNVLELGEKGAQALSTLINAMNSGISEVVKDAVELGKDPIIDAVVEAAKLLTPIIATGAGSGGPSSNVIDAPTKGYDPTEQYKKEGLQKNLDQAVRDLGKTLNKLEEAKAQVELANKEAELAKQKANDATKALEEILAGQTPIDDNKNSEVVEIASGLTKKDAEEQPNFIETGTKYKEWVYRENGDGKKIYNEEHVENYYYPNDGTTFNIYIDLSKVTTTVVEI